MALYATASMGKGARMKIVLIGGNGLIGKQLGTLLRERGHEVIAASRASGVDATTGAGLSAALAGADVVVDVLNSPSFEDAAVLRFFASSTTNLMAAEKAAGVGHHVALSIAGLEHLPDSGYFRAKLAQETLIKSAGVPYSLVRATQFHEFVGAIADSCSDGDTVRVPPILMQTIASADVAAALADVATGPPLNGTVEIAGPAPVRLDELARAALAARGDPRRVVADPKALYYGARVDDRSLMPDGVPRTGPTRFADWLAKQPRS